MKLSSASWVGLESHPQEPCSRERARGHAHGHAPITLMHTGMPIHINKTRLRDYNRVNAVTNHDTCHYWSDFTWHSLKKQSTSLVHLITRLVWGDQWSSARPYLFTLADAQTALFAKFIRLPIVHWFIVYFVSL